MYTTAASPPHNVPFLSPLDGDRHGYIDGYGDDDDNDSTNSSLIVLSGDDHSKVVVHEEDLGRADNELDRPQQQLLKTKNRPATPATVPIDTSELRTNVPAMVSPRQRRSIQQQQQHVDHYFSPDVIIDEIKRGLKLAAEGNHPTDNSSVANSIPTTAAASSAEQRKSSSKRRSTTGSSSRSVAGDNNKVASSGKRTSSLRATSYSSSTAAPPVPPGLQPNRSPPKRIVSDLIVSTNHDNNVDSPTRKKKGSSVSDADSPRSVTDVLLNRGEQLLLDVPLRRINSSRSDQNAASVPDVTNSHSLGDIGGLTARMINSKSSRRSSTTFTTTDKSDGEPERRNSHTEKVSPSPTVSPRRQRMPSNENNVADGGINTHPRSPPVPQQPMQTSSSLLFDHVDRPSNNRNKEQLNSSSGHDRSRNDTGDRRRKKKNNNPHSPTVPTMWFKEPPPSPRKRRQVRITCSTPEANNSGSPTRKNDVSNIIIHASTSGGGIGSSAESIFEPSAIRQSSSTTSSRRNRTCGDANSPNRDDTERRENNDDADRQISYFIPTLTDQETAAPLNIGLLKNSSFNSLDGLSSSYPLIRKDAGAANTNSERGGSVDVDNSITLRDDDTTILEVTEENLAVIERLRKSKKKAAKKQQRIRHDSSSGGIENYHNHSEQRHNNNSRYMKNVESSKSNGIIHDMLCLASAGVCLPLDHALSYSSKSPRDRNILYTLKDTYDPCGATSKTSYQLQACDDDRGMNSSSEQSKRELLKLKKELRQLRNAASKGKHHALTCTSTDVCIGGGGFDDDEICMTHELPDPYYNHTKGTSQRSSRRGGKSGNQQLVPASSAMKPQAVRKLSQSSVTVGGYGGKHVRFCKPLVTQVKYRPYTDVEDIPLLFFQEEELEELEFDRETVPRDQYECIIAANSTESCASDRKTDSHSLWNSDGTSSTTNRSKKQPVILVAHQHNTHADDDESNLGRSVSPASSADLLQSPSSVSSTRVVSASTSLSSILASSESQELASNEI